MELDYTIGTAKSVDDAVEAVVASTAAHGFRVLTVHDVQATLAEKGFEREPLTIVEVCNARYAHEVLSRDVKIGLMLPCPIMVYTQEGETLISMMLPSLLASFYPDAGIGDVAVTVEESIRAIVAEAAA